MRTRCFPRPWSQGRCNVPIVKYRYRATVLRRLLQRLLPFAVACVTDCCCHTVWLAVKASAAWPRVGL
ncbi:predicted protein [Plenodomus lingam JN3]|uniref:Predicted protein n=1 Tax=Leptosphaeria maculans (strain JN3 / isolate v23.1.3 / race Av1-4-5-6-7-8) TaxID=985895 RepID=E5A083_LEPMJ|nr:predicted protein [Plenodomus lingam JN3]CBX96943.1 predicted protein [Plenodomus lingam JN3]